MTTGAKPPIVDKEKSARARRELPLRQLPPLPRSAPRPAAQQIKLPPLSSLYQTPAHKRVTRYPPVLENGRLYHGYHRGMYMLPCDEKEAIRLQFLNSMINAAMTREGVAIEKEFLARSLGYGGTLCAQPQPQLQLFKPRGRVLDLGFGTGEWAIETAAKYPDCYVLGVDLASMQPEHKLGNLDFMPDRDYEDPWCLGEDSWNCIRLAMGNGSVKCWESLYRKAFAHLMPETGVFVQIDLDYEPRWDADDRRAEAGICPDSPLGVWWAELDRATKRAERPVAINRNTAHMLKQAGFVDVQHRIYGLPLNAWPDAARDKHLGRLYNAGWLATLNSLALAPLTRILGYSPERVRELADAAFAQSCDEGCRAYNLIHVYHARKPAAHVVPVRR
ncbi:hypothetical protein KEM52_004209 [Ascosphaera acerosa]|nr:hypothetical protein KEM52_004209 [Ascosphaera acerosa]